MLGGSIRWGWNFVSNGFNGLFDGFPLIAVVIFRSNPILSEQLSRFCTVSTSFVCCQKREEVMYHEPIRNAKAADEAFLAEAQTTIDAQEGQKYLYEAKRVGLFH